MAHNDQFNIWQQSEPNAVFGIPEAIVQLKETIGLRVQDPNLTRTPEVDSKEKGEYGEEIMAAMQKPGRFKITGTITGIVVDPTKFYSVDSFTLFGRFFRCGERGEGYKAGEHLKAPLQVESSIGITG